MFLAKMKKKPPPHKTEGFYTGSKFFLTESVKETQKLGQKLAENIFKNKNAFVIALEGNLGSGKTTFVQGMARGLGIEDKITSPTFVIIKKFFPYGGSPAGRQILPLRGISRRETNFLPAGDPAKCGTNFKFFYHIDCYRINKPEELIDLGFKEIIESPENIVVVEWPERIKGLLPKSALKIKFSFIGPKTRKIIIKE